MSASIVARSLLLALTTLTWAVTTRADDHTEDLITVVASGSKIIAVIGGTRSVSLRLKPGENVLWKGARGNLGAVLTDDRFAVITVSSHHWRSRLLKPAEEKKARTSLSPNLAVLATANRVIAYQATFNRFVEARLPLNDALLAVKTGDHVAVVLTNNLALGLTENTSSFIGTRLRINETIEDVTTTASTVQIQTSERLLSFAVNGTSWKAHRLD